MDIVVYIVIGIALVAAGFALWGAIYINKHE